MSEDDIGLTTADLIAAMRSSFEALVKGLMSEAQGDVRAYAQQLTQEFGRYLERARKGDATAIENLRDLRAQVLLIAVKREIIAQRELMEEVQRAVETAAIFAVRVLIAAI